MSASTSPFQDGSEYLYSTCRRADMQLETPVQYIKGVGPRKAAILKKVGIETLEDCLLREWREELGIDISIGENLGVFSHAYTHFRVTVHAFKCVASGEEPEAHEHSELRWVKPDELQGYPMGKVDREISRTIAAKS